MKKLFISQPMKGKTNEEIRKEREEAIFCAKELTGNEIEVIDSFFENAPADARPLWYLGESLKLLSTADVAYFAPVGRTPAAARLSISARSSTVSTSWKRERSKLWTTQKPFRR